LVAPKPSDGLIHQIATETLCLILINSRATFDVASGGDVQVLDRFFVDRQTVEFCFSHIRHCFGLLFFLGCFSVAVVSPHSLQHLFMLPTHKALPVRQNHHTRKKLLAKRENAAGCMNNRRR
jgi:hypothetical protein